MKNLYNESEAQAFMAAQTDIPAALALRIYTSRLIGRDPELVLHGGGNTSVKLQGTNLLGEPMELLHVKGSGADLATIDARGLPGLDLTYLRRLRTLDALSDEDLQNELRTHLRDASSPDPSLETLLHCFLPQTFIDHTHADSILVLTAQPEADARVREALGAKVAILPFIMPGFPLAKAVSDLYDKQPDVEAIVLGQHGLVTFGDDARTAYTRTIELVSRAEAFIAERTHGRARPRSDVSGAGAQTADADTAARFVQCLRGRLAHARDDGRRRRFILEVRSNRELVALSQSDDAQRIVANGVLTPDHILYTKNHPLFVRSLPASDDELRASLEQAVEEYTRRYDAYFEQHAGARRGLTRLDPYPRVILAAGVGLVAAGFDRQQARITADIAEHTLRAKQRAEELGGFVPIPEPTLFDMEYWSLEQKKLARRTGLALRGQVALVTGGGGAIGLGVADRLLAAGAVVCVTDIDGAKLDKVRARLACDHDAARIETVVMDVTDRAAVEAGFRDITMRTGGIDILVPNAGVAHVDTLENLGVEDLRRSLDVNLIGTLTVIQAATGVFRRQGSGGHVVLISTKNVFEPGASFGAHSASKAAAHQLAKVAALELAELGVRVNMVSPDAVFGDEGVPSGLWETVGPDRMRARGLSPGGLRDYYRGRNLLKAEVLAAHVGNGVVFFVTEQTPTTGATLPVDGGLPGAFPR